MFTPEQEAEFDRVAREMLKFINNNCHPHTMIVVTPTCVEILEGAKVLNTEDYVTDKELDQPVQS